jgi:hypothetical protein
MARMHADWQISLISGADEIAIYTIATVLTRLSAISVKMQFMPHVSV